VFEYGSINEIRFSDHVRKYRDVRPLVKERVIKELQVRL